MSLSSYQKQVDEWVNQYKVGYFKPLEILARLTEEVGELAREVNHLFGPKKKKSSDVIFTLSCLANLLNIDLDKHFRRVMDKYNGRDNNRWEKK